MTNTDTHEPGSLTAPEARALIEAAQRVVWARGQVAQGMNRILLYDAIAHLAETLRHVTPEPAHADH